MTSPASLEPVSEHFDTAVDERIKKVSDNLHHVVATVERALDRAGLGHEVLVLPVTKSVGPERAWLAVRAGFDQLGENRVQEAVGKVRELDGAAGPIRWHLIGHLQTNKVRRALGIFEVIQSVDSVRLAEAIDAGAATGDRKIRILLEVNSSGEGSKFGFTPTEMEEAVPRVLELRNLRVEGLMTVGPPVHDPADARPAFRLTRELRDRLARGYPEALWSTLSMGMSDDYEVAIEEGSTLVRLGRAIFGPRV